jgi:anaerobic selenocysteine-containing dehydrogenase
VTARCLRALRPERLIDALLRIGPYRLSLNALRKAPHGLDLGPLQPRRLSVHLASHDRHIDVAPAAFVSEARRTLLATTDRDPCGDLVLIGRRQVLSNNSWMHNIQRSMRGHERCALLVHPDDARQRGLSTGMRVRLESSAGAITVPIEVSTTMMPGVVSLPHGWGHDRHGIRLAVAGQHAGASMNDVTSENRVDTLSGNAAFNGVVVRVQRAG